MNQIKKKIKQILFRRCGCVCPHANAEKFFSQDGEDVVASRILGPQRQGGTYVDVGCNHPISMSNTYRFYLQNWSGIAIDPNPDFKKPFEILRPRDTFVNMGVSERTSELTYYRFIEPLLNTFVESRASEIAANSSKLIGTDKITTTTLESILKSKWPEGKNIDFLSIDCEGLDLEVLRSHNFELFPADLICIEIFSTDVLEATQSPAACELAAHGYTFLSKLSNSCIFRKRSCKPKLA